MMHDRVAAYLNDLARALRDRGAYTRDLVDEVRDHLVESVEGAERRGLSAEAAQDEALTRIGTPAVLARHAAANVPPFRRILLTLCLFTICAVAYLSLSMMILQPPRASHAWPAVAAFVVVFSGLTFVCAKSGGLSAWIRPVLMFGTLVLGSIGSMSVYAAATGDFEGYRAVLGMLFTVQALLTLVHLRRGPRDSLSRA